jgi:ribosome-associated protein
MMEDDEQQERKSKSQIKREHAALQDLAKELVEMSVAELAKLPLSDRFREQVMAARKMQRSALARQLRYLGKLIQQEALEDIHAALDTQAAAHKQQVQAFHQLERWRDGLLAEDHEVMAELCVQHPDVDRQYINQLVRNARKEQDQNKPPKSSRALFQYLKTLG